MHMADALISPAVGGTLWAASAALLAHCARRVRQTLDDTRVPLMGVIGAFIFTAQMINFSIPATGSIGHLVAHQPPFGNHGKKAEVDF
jgi:cobalt/nickel transport system permease protein